MFNSEQMIDIGGGYNHFFTQKVDVSSCSANYLQKHDIGIYKKYSFVFIRKEPFTCITCITPLMWWL